MKYLLLSRIALLALIGMTSCALPPREAWRVIQKDGLIPYIAVEIGKRPVPPYVVRVAHPERLQRFSSAPARPTPPKPTLPMVALTPSQTLSRQTPPALVSSKEVRPLPSARYFDTSPVTVPTTPARSLDQPATPAVNAPKPSVQSQPPVVARSTTPAPSQQRQKISVPTSSDVATTRRKETTPPQSPKPQLKETASVASTPKPSPPSEPKVSPKPTDSTPPTQPIVKASEDSVISTPYGKPVPGRPGLVSSPYAGQYQLVDVAGLSPGQEVKCPYSGKIFKVPAAQIQAINKAPELSSPPAPVEKKP